MAIDRGGSTAKRKPKNNKRKPAKNSRGNERRGTSVKTKPKKTNKPSRLETQERKSSNKPRQTMVKSGAIAARENPANIARRGAQSYIIKDKAQTAVTMPVKVPSGILKNAQNGVIRTAGGGNTRSDERLTNKTQREHYQSKIQEEKDRQEQIEKRKKTHEKNGYKYGDKFIKTADKFTKTVDKKFDKAKERDLEYGASVFSDTKHDVPIYTKYAKGKAKEAAKASLKESGVTQKAGREVVDKWVDKTEKEWKKNGYDVKDDTVITDDGKTWGQVKQEAYDSQSQHIKNVRADYINKATRNAGKMSAKDLYKAGVPMASEFIDYGVPYMATAKGSLKVAEAIMKKAAKAGKVTGKSIPKVEKAVEGFVKSGNLDPKAAEKLMGSLNRKIAAKSAAKTLTKEGIANALQDATIGTTIDLAKGLGEGLKGEELEDYMKKNALFNLAFGAPLIGVAGASGAKMARREMAEEFAGKVNASLNLSKADGIKLENLLKKQQKGDLSTAEIKTLETLQQKALKEGGAIVDSKGKIQVNQSRYATDDLTRPEVAEYYKYKAQDARGTLDPRDRNRFNELQYKVDTAYKRTESFANDAINIKDRKIKSKDQGDIENAIRFFERTGDKAKLERANHALEIAKAETRKLNDSLSKAMDVMEEKTGIKYEWIDDEEMFNRAGVRGKQGYTDVDGTVVVNRDSPQAWQEVLGHETGHLIKKSNTEAFEKFGNQLEQYAKDIGEWDYVLADMKQRYPELDFNGEDFREEVVSEMVGKYIFGEDGKFLKRLAGEDPTLFERIVEYIKNLIKSSENKELAERLSKITDDVSNEIVTIKKNAENITGDSNGNVAPPSERGNANEMQEPKPTETEYKRVDGEKISAKVRWSQDYIDKSSRLAPVGKDGFYSYAREAAMQLGKNVKSSPESLLRYMKKKGVSAEEMKWTGLNDFLSGKEAITKQELIDFIDANSYELQTVVNSVDASSANKRKVDDALRKWLEDEADTLDEIIGYEVESLREFEDAGFDLEEVFGKQFNTEEDYINAAREKILENPSAAINKYGMNAGDIAESLGVASAKDGNPRWGGYSLQGGKNYREYIYRDPRSLGYDNNSMNVHWGEKDVVVHSRIQDFTELNDSNMSSSSFVRFLEKRGRFFEERAYRKIMIKNEPAVEEIKYGKYKVTVIGYKTTDGKIGLQFQTRNTQALDEINAEIGDPIAVKCKPKDFSDAYMDALDEIKKSVASVEGKPFSSPSNTKVLHVDEIQSDWHNEGHKKGYGKKESTETVADRVFADSEGTLNLWSKLKQLGLNEELGRQNTYHFDLSGGGGVYATPSGRLSIVTGYDVGDIIKKDLGRLPTQEDLRNFVLENDGNINIGDAVPDAPYKNNYTEYAMKRALREAVENDYEFISWTTAEQQANRWSHEYMEGYRIEYDQEIPSFMKKYVGQWGGKVEKIRLAENGEEVWGVKITDEMRKSIQEKGQKRWSNAGKGAVGVDKDMANFAEELFKKGHDPNGIKALTGWSVGKDGKARLEFSDADMRLKFKMKDLRRGNGIIDGRLKDLIDHEELFKYYPQLKDIVVEFVTKRSIKGNGEYYSIGDAKFININKNLPKEEMLDTLIHEIQHAIQEEEGFAGGASTEFWKDVEGNIDKTVTSFQEKYPQYEWATLGDKTFVVRDKTDADMVDLDTGEITSAPATESKEYVTFNPNDNTISFSDEFKKLDKQTQSDMTDFAEAVKDRRAIADASFNDAKIYGNRLPSEYSAYRHTAGEWEAEETASRRNMSQDDLDRTPRFEDETPIVREDFDKWYGKKFSQAKAEDAKSGIKETKAKIAEVDKKSEGKLSETRRKELEQRRRTLEEQLAEEERELNKLNRPLYEKRLADAKKRLKELEAKKNKANGDELVKINKQITSTKSTITRNENLIKNEPKQYVSDIPPKSLTDDSIKREYNSIQKTLRDGKGKSILAREAREERLEALRKEAEKRGVEVRGNIELADELIKEKRFGWEEAKSLKSEINELDKQISALNKDLTKGSKTAVKSRSAQIRELESERAQKNTRLSQVIENSKSVVPEGKTAREVFDEVVGGNTLKPKGSGKKFNAASAIKYIEENGGKGAVTDIGRTIRRKTESSLIEYETAGKALMKNGYKELGQSLLDQTNNVIVYKNKAAAAVESHRASADGTKVGKSLNDVFKVKDKHGKVVNLLLEENARMRNDLSNYLFCKHSFARDAQGKKVFGVIGEDGKPKWTTASSKQFMDEIVEEYGERTVAQFERGIREYIDYLNEYRLDTGLISKELLDKLEDIYPYYIPTNRAVLNKPPTEYELPKTAAEVDNGIKRAVGGDEPLEDLYTQLVKMTMATIRSGEQNKMVAMYAKAHGIEPATLPKDATADDVLESSIDAFDSNRQGGWKIRFYQDGKAVTIPVNRHAAKGLREFNGQDYATLMAVATKVGKTLHMREYKGLITDWNVVFGVRNGMRDSQQALVNSKDTRWYVKSIPRAMAAITDENNAFRILYDANGGRYSTLQQINRLDEIGALNEGKSTVMKGLEKIEDFNGIIEMKPRMQEFIGTIQKEADRILGRKGVQGLLGEIEAEAKVLPTEKRREWIEREYAQRVVDLIKERTPDIIATAIRNSADITVNFSRSGVVTRALNVGFVPYLNPSVQGLSKMMRMFTESKAQGFGKLVCFGAKLGVLTIAPSVANEILCQNNEAYQRINTRDKDNAFFIPMSLFGGDKDKFIKIPKPRENAVLAEPFEYGVRLFLDSAQYGTPDEFEQMFRSAQDNVGVVSVWQDNIISPVVNTIRNKTWYGGDILSKQELENIENEEAWKNYDETTSLLGKEIGKKFNISPKKVDNIMDSYFGLIFDFGISQTSQKNINDVYSSPKNFLMNNPITQQFTKDTVFSNKYAVKFWDNVDELNKGHKGGNDTIEKREYMAKYGYDTFTYDSAIANIDNDENIPKTEKVEMKRELRKYKNQLLHRALEGKDVVYDPMQRIINLYKDHGIKNATDICLSTYADGDHADAYKHLKQSKEYRDATPAEKKEWQRKFLKTYKDIKKIARFTGDSDKFVNYSTVEYVCVKNGYTKGHIANMYAWKSKEYAVEKGMENMKKYIDDGYTEKNFKITMRELNRGADSLNDEDKRFASQLEDYNKAMINAEHKNRDGAFLVSSPYMGEARMNAARCLVEGHSGEDYKWTDKRINKFCKKYDITHDKKYKYDNDQVIRAINKEYADKTPEEKAAVFVVITGDTENNPFGNIGDYSHKGDTGAFGDDGGSRRGRGGHGGGGGGGGGSSSGGTMPKTKSGAIKGKITDPFSTSNGTKKSNLDDAYRKRVKKLLKK